MIPFLYLCQPIIVAWLAACEIAAKMMAELP